MKMRARADVDRLVRVDVRSAIRRTRLPLVASLFLAALLGAAPVIEPAPATDTAVVAAHSRVSTTAVSATALTSAVESAPAEPAAAASLSILDAGASAVVVPVPSALTDQADRAARAPRAPPHV
jgi:transcription elongation GreA/GreB family factor